MDIWVVSNILDKINNAVILSTASKQMFMTLLCAAGTGMNREGG